MVEILDSKFAKSKLDENTIVNNVKKIRLASKNHRIPILLELRNRASSEDAPGEDREKRENISVKHLTHRDYKGLVKGTLQIP